MLKKLIQCHPSFQIYHVVGSLADSFGNCHGYLVEITGNFTACIIATKQVINRNAHSPLIKDGGEDERVTIFLQKIRQNCKEIEKRSC